MINVKRLKKSLTEQTLFTRELWDSHHLGSYECREFNVKPVLEALTELDRLQKKEVAMKVIKQDKEHKYLSLCPNCKSNVGKYLNHTGKKYCTQCGQLLDWRDENEQA